MLEFKVTKQTVKRVDREDPATDSVDYLEAKFDFTTTDWDGTVKVALFRLGTKPYKATVNSSGICRVPWEVLVASKESTSSLGSKNKVFVSVTGTNGSTVITTNEVRVELATSGKAYGDGENSGTPTPSEFEQFVNTVKDEVATINDTAEAVKQAASDVEKTAEDLAVSIDEVEELAKSNEETAGIIVNKAANAFKGTASGEVVRVDDVSPIEHTANILVHGKNLLPFGTIEITKNQHIRLDNPIPAGTYTISAYITSSDTDGELSSVSINNGNEVLKYISFNRNKRVHSTFTVTKPITSIDFCAAYNYSQGVDDTGVWSDIQIEEGNTATEYTPYIDPSTVTLTRCGKNILNIPDKTSTITNTDGMNLNAVANGGGITLKGVFNGGTPKAKVIYTDLAIRNVNYFTHASIIEELAIKIPKGTYTFTANESISSGVASVSGGILLVGELNGSVTNGTATSYTDGSIVTVESDDCYAMFVAYVYSDAEISNFSYTAKPQLEAGELGSEWEKGIPHSTYTPNADVTCEFVSVSPTMTLLTDTEGITIECEYNRDTNIVMGDIETAIDGILAIQNAIIGGDYS